MFTEFRVERGLWMLAALYFAIWAGMSLLCLYGETRDLIRGVVPEVSLIVDAAIATAIMHGHTKFLWKVISHNLSIFRE